MYITTTNKQRKYGQFGMGFMTGQMFGGIFLIVFGLANVILARRIVEYFVRTDSKRIFPMQFNLYPWLASYSLWGIRFGGIFCIFFGFIIFIDAFNP